jgi:hypothetical protein
MKTYRVLYGSFVRMYADWTIEAEDSETARKLAIEQFKANNDEMDWYDAQFDNIAQPSIVSIQDIETNETVLEGFDFPITASDARDYASGKMLEALEFVRMTFADIEASKRKGYYTECPKIVAEAIAEAAFPPSEQPIDPSLKISAECHSDDHAIQVEFDAAPWFAQASIEQIKALEACGWRGDYPADAVAQFFADTTTQPVFTYLHARNNADPGTCGFECSVNKHHARRWLDSYRPNILSHMGAAS